MLNGKKQEEIEYLEQFKIPGCDSKRSVKRDFAFQIPAQEKKGKSPLSNTAAATLFKVDYWLRCFLKYNSIFEIGQGTCVEFPIYILPRPIAKTDQIMEIKGVMAVLDLQNDTEPKQGYWEVLKPGKHLKALQVSSDLEKVQRKSQLNNFIWCDELDVGLPKIGTDGIIPCGYEDSKPWIDY